MLEKDFFSWLVNQKDQQETTASSRRSNCLRVEQFEGDLDEHFERDRCRSLLNKLVYTTEDARRNHPPKHKIPIDGNQKTGTATLKQAIELYVEFKMYIKNGDVILPLPAGGGNTGVTKNPAGKKGKFKATPIGNAQNLSIRYILSNLGNESFNENDWEETKKYFDNKCAYCGSSDALEIDHAVPINKTNMGEHRLGNMIPSCKSCNNKKADKDYEEFLKDKDYAIEKIEKIKAYMDSRKYVPIENNEQLKIILNTAHQEISDVAKRYIKLINDLFINNKDEPA